MTTRRRHYRRVAIGASTALFGLLAQPSIAQADQITDMKARAAQLASQIDALGLKESALSEQYDKSVLAQQQAEQAVAAAAQGVRTATAAAARSSQALKRDAIESYIGNSAVAAPTGGSIRTAEQAILGREYASMATDSQRQDLDRYRTTTLQAQAAERQLDAAARQAAGQVAAVRNAEATVQQAQVRLQNTYAQVKGQLATLVAQAQAAREAEQQRQAQLALAAQQAAAQQAAAQQQPKPSAQNLPAPSHAPRALPSLPVPSPAATSPSAQPAPLTGSGGAAAVAAAETRLGDPYVWGAAGPETFDCSGLTMWAWAHAGVSLPHYSGAQYAATTHIPMSDLRPGDLVFFADPGEHEAMYIGNGQIIEAPHTGAVVRIMPLYSQFVLASRP